MDWDRLVGRILPYVVIGVLGSVAVFIYFGGHSLAIDAIAVGLGLAGGAVTAYFIYHSLEQERNIGFMDGEEVILRSMGPKTHVVLLSIGEQDYPFEPVRASIYLTNIGILAEAQGSGETTVYIPFDKMTEFGPDQNGIRIRYVNINAVFAEALIFVEDRDDWIQTMAKMLNARAL